MHALLKTGSVALVALIVGFTAVPAQAATRTAHAAAPKAAGKAANSGVVKMAVTAGVTLEEAASSMRLRANALNMKLVGELPLSGQVEAITGQKQRLVTIFQFCDALTAKALIDLDIDFAVYMPCRIALIEDAKGKAWLIMMDIDVDAIAKEKKVPPALKKRIQEVRATLINIMEAGAKGDL